MKHQRILELVNEIALEDSEAAYKELFSLLFLPLRQFANSIVKSDMEAEEIASDVLFVVWQQRKQLLQVRFERQLELALEKDTGSSIWYVGGLLT